MQMQSSLDKFLRNDNVFNTINKQFVTLQENDIKDNNKYLTQILLSLIKEMKETDTLFKTTYQRIMFAGSYYKDTKVGKPEEFDLNIIIQLPPPFNYSKMKFESSQPGFIKIRSGLTCATNNEDRMLQKWILDDNLYIDQSKLRRWLESVLTRTQCRLRKGNETTFQIENCRIDIKKSGPAFTLLVTMSSGKTMSIDLVPVLEFTNTLQQYQSKLGKYMKKEWLAVPKPLIENGKEVNNLLWRLCFYQQEREILIENGRIKPVIRQMKKLRDNNGWKSICSYFIEMLAINYVLTLKNWNQMPFTMLFFNLLNELKSACEKHRLNWYWNTNLNLLARIKSTELVPIAYRLNAIIKDIQMNIMNNDLVIAKYILTECELRLLQTQFSGDTKKMTNAADIIRKSVCTTLTNYHTAVTVQSPLKISEEQVVEKKSISIQTDPNPKMTNTSMPLFTQAQQNNLLLNKKLESIQEMLINLMKIVQRVECRIEKLEEKIDANPSIYNNNVNLDSILLSFNHNEHVQKHDNLQ